MGEHVVVACGAVRGVGRRVASALSAWEKQVHVEVGAGKRTWAGGIWCDETEAGRLIELDGAFEFSAGLEDEPLGTAGAYDHNCVIEALQDGRADVGFLRDAGSAARLTIERVLTGEFVATLPATHRLAPGARRLRSLR